MGKMTIADVAREAGVSKSTVSQYLNKRYEYMSEKTKHKIEEAIENLGYHPNYLARSLKQKRTSMVGIIVANILHYFSTAVIRGIEDFCQQRDLHAIVCNADDDSEKEKRYIEMLRAKQVDGLIIFPSEKNMELYKSMIAEGYPVVFVDRKVEGGFSVVTDNQESTYKAIRHFIKNGHHNIAFVAQPLIISTRQGRFAGYKQALAEAEIPLNPDYVIESGLEDMAGKLEALFSLPEKPTALFAGNDRVFLVVMEFLKKKGMKLGQDLEMVVFDNIPFKDLLESPMTFINQPALEMGEKAAELLFEQMKKEGNEPEEYVFPSWRE